VRKREPLSSMAYFCLTVLESSVGQKVKKRNASAKQYGIHYDVLDKLGKLTGGTRGEPMTARKMDSDMTPHTPNELQWIEAAVKAIIRRVAEVAAGASVKQISMSDLPPL
jgi:hypothetical protein